jgi:uncharacterized membrane protein (UPF0127 family)
MIDMPARNGETYVLKTLDDKKMIVEVSVTAEARIRGLSGRSRMPTNTGMLFIFDTISMQSMWMVEMRFSLDILWLDEYMRIVNISYDCQPCPDRSNCPFFSSVHPVKYAIELNEGAARAFGLDVGDTLLLSEE